MQINLQICTVNTKKMRLFPLSVEQAIYKINDIVPVAKIGAQLPNGLKLRKAKFAMNILMECSVH